MKRALLEIAAGLFVIALIALAVVGLMAVLHG